jgi:hypothetical protein
MLGLLVGWLVVGCQRRVVPLMANFV